MVEQNWRFVGGMLILVWEISYTCDRAGPENDQTGIAERYRSPVQEGHANSYPLHGHAPHQRVWLSAH